MKTPSKESSFLIACAIGLAAVCACVFVSRSARHYAVDRNAATNSGTALNTLRRWGSIMERLIDGGENLDRIDSLATLADVAIRKNYLDASAREKFTIDPWNTPYSWEKRPDAERKVFRILSFGKDRVFQDGSGDDLFVDVIVHVRGEKLVYVKPLP
jgi:hypothetical protein